MFRSAEEHNQYQRAYYQQCERRTIQPRDTPYVQRQLERVQAAADLRVERFGFLPGFAADTKVGQSLERGLDRFVALPPLRALQAFQVFSGTLVGQGRIDEEERPAHG